MVKKQRLLWAGKTKDFNKERVDKILENGFLPADPKAYAKDEGEYWCIYGNAKVDYVKTVVKK